LKLRMKKRVFGRKLSRTKNQRKALFRGLISSLVENKELTTTLAKAKSIKGETEKLVTRAKKGTLWDRKIIFKTLNKRHLVDKLVNNIAPSFKEKKGGYLRIVKLGTRIGDGAEMAKVLFTEEILEPVVVEKPVEEKKGKGKPAIPKATKSKTRKPKESTKKDKNVKSN